MKYQYSMRNPYHLIATGFGIGLIKYAPGTIGSITSIPIWFLVTSVFHSAHLQVYCIVLSASIGIYACQRASRDIGIHDHGSIVWDEFIGMWITLLIIPDFSFLWTSLGLLIFRVIDIWKPWPIGWLDKSIRGGFGIMIDDIAAGTISSIILYCLHSFHYS